ncbi:hypothetical protein BDZ94DRAFT_1266679 [Collybia nuda]|uniref:Uncharacterized protein n=1 Tax=Collybia nuda TaxID=64659 RepID=A0A9P5Y2B4_9AGAR|nr:hypothetical protein BDZ94DRAFT_1266679 [Collybia nuda]
MENTTETFGVSTSHSESSRQSRIHFPIDPSRSRPLPPETPQRTSAPAFRSPPVRRSSPLNPQAINPSMHSRRRVRSVDTPGLVDAVRSRRMPVTSTVGPLRGLNTMTHRHPEIQVQKDAEGVGIFSDEYDLSHEDPRILQDVQRALKFKARREARLGQHQVTARNSEEPSLSSSLNNDSSTHAHFLVTSSPSPRKASVSSEIDFGPSVGVSYTHPVPASLDNGITLDWSGYAFYERSERKWHLSTVKRKGKEKLPQVTTVIDQQAKAHTDKLSGIKALSTPHTQRKAEITRDQLGRRYDLIYGALSTKSPPPNLAKVVQWYGTQDVVVRSSLEKAEPFTWLKHLNRRGSSTPERSLWHLSALIIEECLHAETLHDSMNKIDAIPEDFSLHNLSPSVSPPFMSIKSNLTPSRSSSDYSLEQALAKNLSFEGRISFEPLVETTQHSLDLESRRSFDSHHTATNSSSHIEFTSPHIVNRPHRDLVPHAPKNLLNDNNVIIHGDLHSDSDRNQNEPQNEQSEGYTNIPPEANVNPRPGGGFGIIVKVTTPTPGENSDGDPFQARIPHAQNLRDASSRMTRRRRVRTSLPSIDRSSKASESKRQQLEADERKTFETKTRLLAEMTTHNHRIRQLLNRISVGVREFDAAQSNAVASLSIPDNGLPRELLDAFSHDPAAVTGATRRFRGWRAVDDIYNRLVRQRDTFQAFLSRSGCNVSTTKSVLDDPITTLVHSVEALEVHNNKIVRRAKDVGETLLAVQDMHSNVKTHYKATLSHTSVVYPELSNIVALEESYKDQYQQIWELGMDTLTLLLDTVTPFWRTYGKPIGEDVRDFLIIPLYRNEFTGEPKRYLIHGFPTRSWRHWFGLGLFFLSSIAINILQARAAISSAIHYNLPMIPYESVRWTTLPFFWVSIFIQWWAVVVEFAVVMVQIGILLWWAGWSVKIFS